MNYPTIPTDNLYKFLAIFGLALIISNEYFYNLKDNNFYDYVAQSEGNFEIAKLNMERILVSETIFNEAVRDTTVDINIKYLKNLLEERNGLIDNLNQNVKEAAKLNGFKQAAFERVENAKSYYKFIDIIGFIMMFFGFTGWYIKHQRYIDAEIKVNGEKYLKKLKK